APVRGPAARRPASGRYPRDLPAQPHIGRGDMTGQRHATIVGVGSVLPERIVPNAFFDDYVDTSDEWIRDRTGIKERHFAREDQTTSDLAVEAGRIALETAGIAPEQLDLIVCA